MQYTAVQYTGSPHKNVKGGLLANMIAFDLFTSIRYVQVTQKEKENT